MKHPADDDDTAESLDFVIIPFGGTAYRRIGNPLFFFKSRMKKPDSRSMFHVKQRATARHGR
ncbi:hypothetical protein [uncultured Slackia sp.]|uniref:hypothetical protein n=1 Tax=uncultured Slackia sp. TaxID=665903 RepID=UPI0026DF4275|nr:hypothetical protein [uncultured Slackia sp.]